MTDVHAAQNIIRTAHKAHGTRLETFWDWWCECGLKTGYMPIGEPFMPNRPGYLALHIASYEKTPNAPDGRVYREVARWKPKH